MGFVLYESADHRCIAYNDLVPAKMACRPPFLISMGRSASSIPAARCSTTPCAGAGTQCASAQIDLILCSHQDPDVIGSVDKWLLYTKRRSCARGCGGVSSRIWCRTHGERRPRRYLLVETGARIALGDVDVLALPAHFMHSVGNLSFFDETSRILFSGDICSGLVASGMPYGFVEDFDGYRPCMEGFHRRYMAGNRIVRLWVDMVRELDPAMIVPQHGMPFRGDAQRELLDWLYRLECGVDLMGPEQFRAHALRPALAVAD